MVPQKVSPLYWTPNLVDAFAPSVLANPWGFGTPSEVLHGSYLYEFEQGKQHALVAIKPVYREHGTRVDVTGMVSMGDRFHAKDLGSFLEAIAQQHNAHALAMATLRPHLVQAAKRMGWTEAGALMTKRLDLQ